MLTEKDYCDYDTCVALKELGIDCDSPYYYDNKRHLRQCGMGHYSTTNANCMGVILAIHLYDAQKWLREEKKIEVVILGDNYIGGPYHVDIYAESGPIYLDRGNGHSFYESALNEGIKEAVKLLKEVLAMREIDFNRDSDEW